MLGVLLQMVLPAAVAVAPIPGETAGADSDTVRVQLEAVQVTAARLAVTAADAPLAVAVEARDPLLRATEPGASLEGPLRHLPGLWVNDRENFARGERLSVRGMGARAGFGVRGVRVVLDGIPLTLADGQTPMAIADPAMLRRAELIRGPASALWGNASGGVLFLHTLAEEDALEARVAGGSFGLLRTDIDAARRLGGQRTGLAVSHLRREGFREHSAFEVTRGRAFGQFALSDRAQVSAVGAFEWAPHQQHPGALTAEELLATPRQAQTLFVDQRAGKDSRQAQLGASLRAALGGTTMDAGAAVTVRRLENALPFAFIEFDRIAGSGRIALERTHRILQWTAGLDGALQRDDRRNWANVRGERGELRLDKLVTVLSGGAFAQALVRSGALTGSAGLRYDLTHFDALDRFLVDGDQSGSRSLGAFSPALGASYRLATATLFASASTAFETPTTTELINRPDGAGGFNPELRPQRTRGLEAGLRGTDRAGRIFYDVALFHLAITDQLAPFQGADGRTYYRNVDRAGHTGLEALVEWQAAPWLRVGATYNASHFVFTAGALRGNRLPGVPPQRFSLRSQVRAGDLVAHLSALAAGPQYANDANTARADGYVVVDLRLVHAGLAVPGGQLVPFLQVQNLFDARYAGSVALNARGGRYYEPAAGRALQAGLSWRMGG